MSPAAPFTLRSSLRAAEMLEAGYASAIANFLISHVNHIYFLEFARRDKRKGGRKFPSLHLVPKLLILNPGIT